MKTKQINWGRMKSIMFLVAIFSFVETMSVKAIDYGFSINGTQVNSSNCSDVFGDGKVKYDYTTNIVRLTDVSFNSSKNIIENKSCKGLHVLFYGTNTLQSSGDQGVLCESETHINVKSGSTTITGNKRGIYLNRYGQFLYLITSSDAILSIRSSNMAIQGHSDWYLTFENGNFQLVGPKGNFVDLGGVFFNRTGETEVQLSSTNPGYPSVNNVCNIGVKKFQDLCYEADWEQINDHEQEYRVHRDYGVIDIVDGEAYYDYFDENAKSIVYSGDPVSGRGITITNKYVAAVNENFFPDLKFCQGLIDTYGSWITKSSIDQNPSLNVMNRGISSLEGIRLLTDLKELYCSYNNLTSLNLSDNENLVTLYCDHNQLGNLILPMKPSLQYLYCGNNNLTSLGLTYGLKELACNNNSLTDLSVSSLSKLEKLNCGYNNSLTTLTLPETKTSLQELSCNNTGIKYLKASSFTNLVSLNCLYMSSLKSINLSGCTKLEGLTLFNSPKLESLNVTSCTKLNSLVCSSTSITSLDLSSCPALKSLICSYGKLESLNISSCTKLEQLLCEENQLTSLTLPNSPVLNDINCSINQIQGSAMDDLFNSLPNRNGKTSGSIKVFSNTSNEQNVCYTKHVNVAKSKNWDTYQYVPNSWQLYAGATLSVSTNLQAVETDIDNNAPRYNTSGQRVGNDYKGIVIVDGKKAVVK